MIWWGGVLCRRTKKILDYLTNSFILVYFVDNVKKALVQQGYAEYLANIVSSARNVTDDESAREKMQSAADMIVMLLTEGQPNSPYCFILNLVGRNWFLVCYWHIF